MIVKPESDYEGKKGNRLDVCTISKVSCLNDPCSAYWLQLFHCLTGLEFTLAKF